MYQRTHSSMMSGVECPFAVDWVTSNRFRHSTPRASRFCRGAQVSNDLRLLDCPPRPIHGGGLKIPYRRLHAMAAVSDTRYGSS
jgi:hypothetical protein